MSVDKSKTPFMTGYEAHGKGISIHSSPYPKGSKESIKWVNGWQAADRTARKAAEAKALEVIEARPLPEWAVCE